MRAFDNTTRCAELEFRSVIDSDRPFLEALYASTREDVASMPWAGGERQQFLSMQFQAQDNHYRLQFPRARFDIVLWHDRPAGRLYVDRNGDEFRLIDIALLPEHRSKGLGSAIVQMLLEEAAGAGKPVRLRVEPDSPAARLYQRLGFETIADEEVNWHMEFRSAEAIS
jgi:GNAT superfamily N-acetyltransferase